MAISRCAIMAIMAIFTIMAVMAHRDMAIIMVLMGVFLKYSKNADYSQKRCSKSSMGIVGKSQKVWALNLDSNGVKKGGTCHPIPKDPPTLIGLIIFNKYTLYSFSIYSCSKYITQTSLNAVLYKSVCGLILVNQKCGKISFKLSFSGSD